MAQSLVQAALELKEAIARQSFSPPVAFVYNPLEYAWKPYCFYLKKWGSEPKRVLFLGMNPGPWGMAQTGVPFGEVEAVRSWLGIEAKVEQPARTHPKRPVTGFSCMRSEVSGRRLWGLFRQRFGTPERFFAGHFVANYCPLLFYSESGANLTPDKLPPAQASPLLAACDDHLRRTALHLKPQWVIGIGRFASDRARRALEGTGIAVGHVLHPSPASPAANRDWGEAATRQLQALGIW